MTGSHTVHTRPLISAHVRWGTLRMRINYTAVYGTNFAIYPQYSQHLVASTPAVSSMGGNCRSPWHLPGDSDVNGLEYSQIQFQKLSSFEV